MSGPAGPSGWDIAAIIGGIVAVLGALGKAGAWLLAGSAGAQSGTINYAGSPSGDYQALVAIAP